MIHPSTYPMMSSLIPPPSLTFLPYGLTLDPWSAPPAPSTPRAPPPLPAPGDLSSQMEGLRLLILRAAKSQAFRKEFCK